MSGLSSDLITRQIRPSVSGMPFASSFDQNRIGLLLHFAFVRRLRGRSAALRRLRFSICRCLFAQLSSQPRTSRPKPDFLDPLVGHRTGSRSSSLSASPLPLPPAPAARSAPASRSPLPPRPPQFPLSASPRPAKCASPHLPVAAAPCLVTLGVPPTPRSSPSAANARD